MSLLLVGGATVAAVALSSGARARARRARLGRVRSETREGAPPPRSFRRSVPDVVVRVRSAGMTGRDQAAVWGATGAALAVVGWGVAGPVGGLAFGAAAVLAVPWLLRVIARRAEDRDRRAVSDLLIEVARELRAGGVVTGAFERLAAAPGVVGAHVRAVAERSRLGLSLPDALRGWSADHAGRRSARAVDAARAALVVAAEAGARSADPLERLAQSFRAEEDARAEVRAHGAQGRASAYVVGGLPAGALALSAVLDPSSSRILVDSSLGRWCLAIGLFLEALGILWIRRILAQPLAPTSP